MSTPEKQATANVQNIVKNNQLELLRSVVSQDSTAASLTDTTGNTPLHTCSACGHIHIATFLCETALVNPSPRNNDGQTPLHLACEEGHLTVASYLTDERGCDPSVQDNEGKTPLHLAAANNRLSIVRYLVGEKGVDVNCKTTKHSIYIVGKPLHWRGLDAPGKTPLHYASMQGHALVVEYLLTQKECDPMCTDNNGINPLISSSLYGHLQIVKILCDESYCDMYKPSKHGNLPLHTASLGGHLAVVRYFICEKGVDPAIPGRWDRTPLHYACLEGHQDVINFLIDDQGCDPMILDEDHITPLYLASMNGHLDVVQLLVDEKGCNIYCRNNNHDLPLHAASLNGHLAVVRYFICEKGVDPAIPGQLYRTPLHHACQEGHQGVVNFLIDDQRCDPMILDEDHITPLYLASMKGHLNVVQLLVDEKGCDIYCRNNNHNLPLHAASFNGHLAVVRYFICEKGVDPAIPGQWDRTPLHHACQEGHQDIIAFLVNDQGCDPLILDKNSISPLYFVLMVGHIEVVEVLLEYFAYKVFDPDKNISLTNPSSAFIRCYMKFYKPCNPYVNLLVVGDSKSGKSSLVKALIDESKYFGGIRNTGNICSFKSGIVLHEFTSKRYGNVTFCELAGPREYYDSLPVELKCGVLILVINVADDDFKKKLSYWISFLRHSISKVIVVFSHSDLCFPNYLEECKADTFNSYSTISSIFTIDCRKSASTGMFELRNTLSSTFNQQRKDMRLKNVLFIILQFLLQHYKNASVIEVSTAIEKLLSDKFMSHLLKSESKEAYLYELVTELNSGGLILFFKNPSHEIDGWIVLDKTAVVSLVHTAVSKCSSTNIAGLVTYNQIKTAAISVNLNETFLLEYLLSMKYCYEVKDGPVLSSVALKESVFFFPNLIDTEPPATVWPEKNFNYVCLGWTYRCSSVDHFFLPNFIQVLLLRLVYHFKPLVSMNTRTYLQKHLCVWKNGVYCTDGAVECLVEVSADSSAVHLMMRTESLQQLTNMYKLQSSVISKILSTHQEYEYSPQVEMDEFLVLPSVVNSYPPDWNEDALISISDIADAVITSKSHITGSADAQSRVKLASILPIEPLVGLSSNIVKLMFSESNDNLSSKEFLHQLASKVYNKSKLAYNPPLPPIVNEPVESIEMCYAHIDKWRRESNGTFGALLKEISSYSVFCGRNPLVSVLCMVFTLYYLFLPPELGQSYYFSST